MIKRRFNKDAMSPYLKADSVISDMAKVLSAVTDLSDIKIVRQHLSLAGFQEDSIDHYAECAVVYVTTKRKLMEGVNQMTPGGSHENQ